MGRSLCLRLVWYQIIHDYRLSQFKLPHKQDLSSICFYDKKKNQCNVNIFPKNCISFILVKPVKLSNEILQDENCMNVYSPHINAHFEIPRLTKNLSFSSNDNLNEWKEFFLNRVITFRISFSSIYFHML